jgi:hypothetical protein
VSAVATRPARTEVGPVVGRPSARLFDPPGGELSLEESILGVWDELAREGEASCPVCADRIRAAQACDGCGSLLA